ncbi:Uu.00g047830.m01.CDS01 [Anthostomella pinea]|uniref:Uu.00g047830.m01.CDS01 n=1 Tax=Anthostomella pinea TaxID=933095 RepID=A0AAI8YEM1_9PEZI|nr:Uu.00g047830.m01.CDS01 [Anthostomella pinea]
MPPHLHPRSRMTSSLFATTVAVSFLVVAVPHILPCPAPRIAHADSASATSQTYIETVVLPDGTVRQRRRRSRRSPAEVKDGIAQFGAAASGSRSTGEGDGETEVVPEIGSEEGRPRERRECPVPKPGGVIGELMGFRKDRDASSTVDRRRTDGGGVGKRTNGDT